MCAKPIQSTVESLKWIYAVVIALSVSEAFMQFALDVESKAPGIQWDRLPSLCCFLLLVVPFSHGMSRYFCEMYDGRPTGEHYGVWLLTDCVAFMVEAALFFILARSFPANLRLQFNSVVVVLLYWDVVWGTLVWRYREFPAIRNWVITNVFTVPFLTGITLAFRTSTSWGGVFLIALVILARTIADYWTGWTFYFPKVADSQSDEGRDE